MSAKIIVRGQSVVFEITYTDKNGAVITSGISGAKLRIQYKRNGVNVVAPFDLADAGGGVWSYEWASDSADAGTVFWWSQSADQPKSALQGKFPLDANGAAPPVT